MGIMTFKNLKKDKRQRILDAAFSNFTQNAWESVQISQVVIQSQIPRGSFYQYFDTIHDLFFVLVGHLFGKEVLSFPDLLGEAGGDLKLALQLRLIKIFKRLEIYDQGFFLQNLLYFKSFNQKQTLPPSINPMFDEETSEVITRLNRKINPDLLTNLEMLFVTCFFVYLEKPKNKETIIGYFTKILNILLEKEDITRRKNEVIIKNI
ncbi:MAG: TetR/AcrR family transcriptional regulator [Bacilli bacterium]